MIFEIAARFFESAPWGQARNETTLTLGIEDKNRGYSHLIMEHNRYLLWGFTESPQKMTEAGKKLFINVVIRTANKAWESNN